MRSVYTFYTRPNIDRYPLDVNYNQGVRAPMYVEGVQGNFFKDRNEFYNMWPRWPTKFQQAVGSITTAFTFTIPGPFLSKEVVVGCTDSSGNAVSIADDGNGNLQLQVPNSVVSVPLQTLNPVVPGMYNVNTRNPGLIQVTNIGTVDYVTGVFTINFTLAGITAVLGQLMTVFVSQYTTGRPFSLMFWNNEFTVRPVPSEIHKIEIETYLTPVQFLQTTDNPIVNQWWKYLAYLAAAEILRDRQDMDGVAALMEGLQRQESLVLERQGTDEIGQRNATVFASSVQSQGWNQSWNAGGY